MKNVHVKKAVSARGAERVIQERVELIQAGILHPADEAFLKQNHEAFVALCKEVAGEQAAIRAVRSK